MSEQSGGELRKIIMEQIKDMDEEALRNILDFLATMREQVNPHV